MGQVGCKEIIRLMASASRRCHFRLRIASRGRKIFENEFPVSARKGRTTGAAGYLPVNGFLADLHFYALIKGSTLWAIEGA